MRSFVYISLSALAAVAAAASDSANPFNNPEGGYTFKAGSPTILTWDPTTSGTVSLRLQWGNSMSLSSGDEIASDIDNSGSYSWTPSASLPDRSDYTVEIIADEDTSEVNYLPRFSISGATGAVSTSAVSSTTTSSASTSTSTSTGTSSTLTTMTTKTSTSSSSTTTGSTTSNSSTTTGSSTASSSAAASTSAASTTSTSSASSTNSASASTTTVPSTNSGMINRVSGGMMAVVLGAIAFI